MKLEISDENKIDANKLVTGRSCIIGQSGSGKSYAVAVICEELAKNNIGFCIIDTEGEYFSLKQKYPILWVGLNKDCEINIDDADYNLLAKKLISGDFPVIFDVSDVDEPQKEVSDFLKELYKIGSKLKKPYLTIIEEIDKFAPQRGNVLSEIEEISKRGRKRGIGLLIATQRPALVNKNILSQCANQIIGKLTIKNDIDSVKLFFPNKKDLNKLPMLNPGLFFVQGDILEKPKLLTIRKRETTHKASTPKLLKTKIKQTKDLEDLEVSLKKQNIEKKPEVEEVRTIGLKPNISEEKAFEIMKSKANKFKFFGKKYLISELHLSLRPIYICEIKYLKNKLIGRDIINIHVYFDGITGNIVSLNNKFSVISKIKEFLNLSSNEIEVFNIICSKRNTSTKEIANILNKSTESIRNSIRNLKNNNLISSKRKGRNIIYFPFTKLRLPKLKKISSENIDTGRIQLNANKMEPQIKLESLSSFIRGIGNKAEIVNERKIYYPIYQANVVNKKIKRKIFLDGISGKIIKNEDLI